jgi:phosphate-selective porin OprO and OprP
MSENGSIESSEFYIRRLRMRFNGFVWSKKLTYMFQLGFSNNDQNFESDLAPNIIRDAFITYKFNKKWSIGFGQGKLPGNRQRVISSGEQQFTDRSIVNSLFTIDRDFGFQFQRNLLLGKSLIRIKGALSSGEGRNIPRTNDRFCYTGRVEVLPMGEFSMNGDYFEGDWVMEKKPKLSVAGGYCFNQSANRLGGQLGQFLYDQRDIATSFADFIFKYRGWSLSSEGAYRYSSRPNTFDSSARRSIYNGWGVNSQLSKQFKNRIEIAARYAVANPVGQMTKLSTQYIEQSIGCIKYLSFHRVKLQMEATRFLEFPPAKDNKITWIYRFQVELGI